MEGGNLKESSKNCLMLNRYIVLKVKPQGAGFSSQDTEILFSFYCDSWVWLKCFSAQEKVRLQMGKNVTGGLKLYLDTASQEDKG